MTKINQTKPSTLGLLENPLYFIYLFAYIKFHWMPVVIISSRYAAASVGNAYIRQ